MRKDRLLCRDPGKTVYPNGKTVYPNPKICKQEQEMGNKLDHIQTFEWQKAL